MLGSYYDWEDTRTGLENLQGKDWDIAIRYHEFRSAPWLKHLTEQLRKISAQAVLRRAQGVLGSIVHPVVLRTSPLDEVPHALNAEFDLEETLENSSGLGVRPEEIQMTYHVQRRLPVVLSVDTSLSMTGEKLALTAVALSVVLLQFPEDPIGIVAFENEARILKQPEERISVFQLVERFLDVPAKGYTHLEDGLKKSLALSKSIPLGALTDPPAVVLLTDGKYTAGRDPEYLAPQFSHLVVLKMGSDKSSRDLCGSLARLGRGEMHEVGELEGLPTVMYEVVKGLLRGKSFA